MKIDNVTLNEIRNSLDIVDVISNYINLTSKGKNYFGVCPFHDDHSPSMSVSREKQIYTCFSCGATGNVFKFIEDYENISFIEAVKKCADMANISINIGQVKEKKKYQELYDIYELSQKFYQNNINTEKGKKAKEYLHNRNLTDDVIKDAKEIAGFIGVASDLVTFDPLYQDIVENQLGNTLVVNNLDTMNKLGKKLDYKFRIITLDGDISHTGGSLSGGFKKQTSGLINIKYEFNFSNALYIK